LVFKHKFNPNIDNILMRINIFKIKTLVFYLIELKIKREMDLKTSMKIFISSWPKQSTRRVTQSQKTANRTVMC